MFLGLLVVLPSTFPLVFPNLIWPNISSSFLYPIQDDAIHYLVRVNEILKGNFSINNPYFFETQAGGGYTFVGEYLVAFLSQITGSLKMGYLLQVTLYTILSFYLVNQILNFFVSNTSLWVSIIICSTFLLFPVWYLRPVAPSTGIILYLLVLYVSLKILNSSDNIKDWFFSTICTTLLWFVQPVIAIISSLTWIYGVLIEYKNLKTDTLKKFFLLFVSCIFSPIFWYLFVNYPDHTIRRESSLRTGLIDSRMPGGLKELIFSFVLILIFILICYRIKFKKTALIHLFIILLIANLGGNHQILSGKHAFNSTYSRPIIYLVGFLIIIILLDLLVKSFPNFKNIIKLSLVVIYIYSFSISYNNLLDLRDNRPISLEKDVLYLQNLSSSNQITTSKVLAAPVQLSSLFPLYIANKSLYSKEGAIFYPVGNNEILERAILNRFLLGEKVLTKEYVVWIFDGYFNNLRARYAWDREEHQIFIKKQIDNFYQKSLIIQNDIVNNPKYYLEKYSVSGVIYNSSKSFSNLDLCESLISSEVYNLCNLRI